MPYVGRSIASLPMKYRLRYSESRYARAKGRNGWFVPRIMEFEFSEYRDGTPLVTLRLFSRREAGAAPMELTLAISEWESQALAIQLRANEERRRRAQHPQSRPNAS